MGAALALVFGSGCTGSDGVHERLDPPAADLTGSWAVAETETGTCQGTTYPQYRSYVATILQSGNALTFTTPDGSFMGTISGTVVSWSFSRPSGGGTVAGTFTGSVSPGGSPITGAASWTWTSGTSASSCTGTTSVFAERVASQNPAAPSITSAVAGNSQVTLTWDAVSGAAHYSLYRGLAPGSTSLVMTLSTSQSTITWTDRWLTNGTPYYYAVTASNTAGESPKSAEVSATPSSTFARPPAPTNLVAAAGQASVALTFDSVVGATSYQVYRATSPGQMTTYASLPSHLAVISHPPIGTTGRITVNVTYGMTAGTTYYFVVTAGNVEGESDPTPEVSATPY